MYSIVTSKATIEQQASRSDAGWLLIAAAGDLVEKIGQTGIGIGIPT